MLYYYLLFALSMTIWENLFKIFDLFWAIYRNNNFHFIKIVYYKCRLTIIENFILKFNISKAYISYLYLYKNMENTSAQFLLKNNYIENHSVT